VSAALGRTVGSCFEPVAIDFGHKLAWANLQFIAADAALYVADRGGRNKVRAAALR
jgi:hypothetical protein